ncbi:TAT-variant-translocated molybdopterin oxidoreductase [Planctomicrobium piriforme]|uniref:Prokaryotic molybdopterin-containing oxidoreductase family, iron-sulfur binding subunit n=1 Tax=Planctomicrobium piriforme TaxID=1576369 RepID=A0A1I3JEQ0_9PLAN|nr:TAT-variant-translocated molybdopterin oxidoreductase [Planctomicrobium piriforme]SFI58762.1 prokaryotic molybdopterin-containing oxidoreductase family, iron-sulfur binding subunit [Planctomicrobium piriforme]
MLHDFSENADRSTAGLPEPAAPGALPGLRAAVSAVNSVPGTGVAGKNGGGVSETVQLDTNLQRSVKNTTGPRYWKSLEEYSEDPEFLARAQKEFAPGAEWWIDQPSRREFLKTMGASFALAGLTGCTIRQPEEKIIPYVQIPENMIPGKANFYATAMPQPGGAIGLLVESHEGRPTKIEGNPDHPTSLGATDAFSQASVLGLYDPLRTRVVQKKALISSWEEFLDDLVPRISIHRSQQGAGLCLLTEEILSPTLQAQVKQLLTAMPQAKWYQYNAWESAGPAGGVKLAFGTDHVVRHQLQKADIIFSVGCDFLAEGPARVRLMREFMARRTVEASGQATMNRLYVVETTPTQTGAKADHWLRLKPSDVEAMLIAVAKELGIDAGGATRTQYVTDHQANWITVLAADLKAARGRSLVMVGPSLPAELHALAHLINSELGNFGQTVTFVEPINKVPGVQSGTIADLAKEIDAGNVETLFIFGGDPVFTAPAEIKFGDKVKAVPCSIYHSLNADSTALACTWHTPATHYLEEWSDARAEDGTATIIQPLIRPLYEGKSAHEMFNILLTGTAGSAYETVRGTWLGQFGNAGNAKWEKSLHDGVVADTVFAPATAVPGGNVLATLRESFNKEVAAGGDFAVVFRTDPSVFDGRFATNGWLNELPQPFSKLTWGNAAWVGYSTANTLKLKPGDMVSVQKGDVTITVPVWVQPGVPENVITLHLGNGRPIEGHKTVGVDVYPLRDSSALWLTSAKVTPTGKRFDLAATQTHHHMGGRDLIRHGTIQQVQEHPDHPAFMNVGHHGAAHGSDGHDWQEGSLGEGAGATFFPNWPQDGPQWGMTVNLSACTGCNACVVACHSENNISVVGADQVIRGREMHWLRIDTYFEGDDPDNPDVYNQPVMCMHCEHAPCEPVCPVGATTHSHEGLNEMTYNRCIGTRYCSNNCPYKVRRFNFLAYNEPTWQLPVLQMAQNPNVTVRSRGVMEKCTYCVQRISSARIHAKIENRDIRDGEVVTACQSACPSRAISFGNVADEKSAVAKTKEHPLNYGMLTDLNTRPRTSYHAAIRNPNPALAPAAAAVEGHA